MMDTHRFAFFFSKEGLTKAMTENSFAKPARHNLSPETKCFQFLLPLLPAVKIILGRRAMRGAGSKSSALPQPSDKPVLFSLR